MDNQQLQKAYNDIKYRARAMNATIRVKNPDDKPFSIGWDNTKFTWGAGEVRDVPRYLAEHFIKKFAEMKVIEENDAIDKKWEEDKKRKGQPLYKYDETKPGNQYRSLQGEFDAAIEHWGPQIFMGKVADYGDGEDYKESIEAPLVQVSTSEKAFSMIENLPTIDETTSN